MNDQTCKYCGRKFEPLKNSKGLFCSTACYLAEKKNKAGSISSDRIEKILALYRQGMFIHPIARTVRTTFPMVKKVLENSGIYENRIRPQHVKGRRLLPSEIRGFRLILLHLAFETKMATRFDECGHWKNHPEARRWQSNHVAKSQYYKWRNCPSKALKWRLRSRVNRVLRGALKSAPTLKLLGCSLEQFREHLESQFTRGMNWANYGHLWHIDHIEPCSSFDLSDPNEQKRCFHYSNLRPLQAKENWRKNSRIVPTQRELILDLCKPALRNKC